MSEKQELRIRVANLQAENFNLRAELKSSNETITGLSGIIDSQTETNLALIGRLETAETDRDYFKADYIEQSKRAGELFPKAKELESQVAMMRKGFETIKNNCEAGTDDYIWGVAHEILEGATTGAIQKLQELEKYAELGRLAIEGFDKQIVDWQCKGKLNCNVCKIVNSVIVVCEWHNFCQKRAELLNK